MKEMSRSLSRRGEKRYAYEVLDGKPEGKKPVGG
jgi:hypothetical protein